MRVVFVLEVEDGWKRNCIYFGTVARGWKFGREFWTVCIISSMVTCKWLGKKGMLSLRMRIGRPFSCIPEGIFCWHTIKLIYGIQMQSLYNTQNFLAERLVDKIKRAFPRKMFAGWMTKRGLFYWSFLVLVEIIQKGVWLLTLLHGVLSIPLREGNCSSPCSLREGSWQCRHWLKSFSLVCFFLSSCKPKNLSFFVLWWLWKLSVGNFIIKLTF